MPICEEGCKQTEEMQAAPYELHPEVEGKLVKRGETRQLELRSFL
jgi:hypothetical protein